MKFVIKSGISSISTSVEKYEKVDVLYRWADLISSDTLYFRDKYLDPDKKIIDYFPHDMPRVYLYDKPTQNTDLNTALNGKNEKAVQTINLENPKLKSKYVLITKDLLKSIFALNLYFLLLNIVCIFTR